MGGGQEDEASGTAATVGGGEAYDRSVSGARSGAPDGAISVISDVLLILAQAGYACAPPP